MSYGFDVKKLIESIRRVGLINSPVLKKNRDGKLSVVIGYRRIHALKSMGWDKIPCRILSESELTPLECLLLNLHDNLCYRDFNVVEKSMALSRLSSWLQRDEILNNYMPLLGLPSHEPTFFIYCRLDKELEEEIKASLTKGQLSLYAAKMFLDMDIGARSSIFRCIITLKFNINQQKQLIDYLLDISRGNYGSIPDILKEKTLKNIYSDTRMNNPQKVNALIRVLRSRLFPQLTAAETAFKKMVSGLDLPKGVSIKFPPFFEAADYRMQILFKDGKDLKEKIERLSGTEELAKLHDPWEKDSNA